MGIIMTKPPVNRAVWIAKKNELAVLIKRISDHYGGDEVEWLREYFKEVLDAHADDINVALECFRDLERQLQYVPRVTNAVRK